MDLHSRYLTIDDLRSKARARLPHFVWEFLNSGTGSESALQRTRDYMDSLRFAPAILGGEVTPDLRTCFLGQDYALPFGIAPVGMSGLFWPNAETTLAQTAAKIGLPYCLSTVAAASPEDLAPYIKGQGWFQLYPPKDPEIRTDMLKRARAAGFTTLILTVDVAVASRRERAVRSGLTQPPRITPRIALQCALKPQWSLARLRAGMPHMRMLDKYSGDSGSKDPNAHIGYQLRAAPDWDYLQWLRDNWQGPLIVKGGLRAQDAERLERAGVDAIWVSDHGGRQFDGGPCPLQALQQIRPVASLPLIYDSGLETGLDILRAYSLGADFTMLGRAWHYALAALGDKGAQHLAELLQRDLVANLGQLGSTHPKALRGQILSL
jgi:L-lactate dehydrogenase (cytochrome)